MKNYAQTLPYIFLALLILIPAASALSATVSVLPAEPTTERTLRCEVVAQGEGDLYANISWYRNNTLFSSNVQTLSLTENVANQTTGIGSILEDQTTRSEAWVCEADVYNQTNNTLVNSSAVTIQNAAPSVTFPTTTQTVTEGVEYNIQALATDPDGDAITWSMVDLNKSAYDNEDLFSITSSGNIVFTPTYEQRGERYIQLIASDGELEGGRTVLYIIEAINQEPRFDPPLTDQTTNTSETWEYVITASDREDDAFNFTLLSSDLSSVQLEWLTNETARLSLTTGQPLFEDVGEHNITVAVYDIAEPTLNTTTTFTLTIEAINNPPVFDEILTPNATQGEQFLFEVEATDVDTTDELFFSITSSCSLTNPWTIETIDNSSTGALGRINLTLTNDHVACRTVTLQVTDYEDGQPKSTVSQEVFFNITNINDPPELFEIAQTPGTYEQTNMSNLTAAANVAFTYYVHATDPDQLTYAGDTLTYTDNTTLFSINSTTGIITFTPTNSDVGEHHINLTVTDAAGESDSRTMSLTIVDNTAPTIQSLTDLYCEQDSTCWTLLTATDPDTNENLTFTATIIEANPLSNLSTNQSLNLSWLSYNQTNASKTFLNNQVGNYTYNITVTDQWGATDSTTLFVNVSNVNDAPFFDQNRDATPDEGLTIPQPIVVGYSGNFPVGITDPDFINGLDSVELTYEIQGPNTNLFTINPSTISPGNDGYFFVFYNPTSSAEAGEYNVTFTATDQEGLFVNRTLNFTVYNQSQPPNITAVNPYTNLSFSEVDWTDTVFELTSTQQPITNVSVREPNPNLWQHQVPYSEELILNFTVVDPDSDASDLTIQWYSEEELLQTNTGDEEYSYSKTIDWHSQGEYTYTVVVTDELFATTNHTWNVRVVNRNLAPVLLSPIPDRNVTQITTVTNQMKVFFDPDDDLDNSGAIDGNETSNLTYLVAVSDAELLNITFNNHDLVLTPLGDGIVTAFFTAVDDHSATVNSNLVTYTVTAPEEEEASESSSGTGGGGGGGGGAVAIPIPIRSDPEPEAITLLVPEPLSILYNQTIQAPITVQNTGTRELQTITLTARTEAENANLRFSESQIPRLESGDSRNVTLYIENFRLDGTYEVLVIAEAQNPSVNDSAVLFINSLEQTSEGAAVLTKITFARDLLTNNQECLELNELLQQAQNAIRTSQYQTANDLVQSALDGCRFLISESNRRVETPGRFSIQELFRAQYANYALILAIVTVLIIIATLLQHYYSAAKTIKK